MKGKVADANSTAPIGNYNLSITELGGQPILTYPKNGMYDCVVFNGTVVNVQVEAEDYLTYNARLEVPAGAAKSTLEFDIFMSKAEQGMKIVMNNVFFDFNKSTLRPTSFKSLKNLLNVMRRYPLMQIEVSGHTDNVGTEVYNQTLSENRAKTVKEYLVRNGISESRVSSIGKSFKEPIASNDSNEGRQLNRRTEIRITKVK
jgi:outer membrane protein OmpA-like peptidoglycan-associated protein